MTRTERGIDFGKNGGFCPFSFLVQKWGPVVDLCFENLHDPAALDEICSDTMLFPRLEQFYPKKFIYPKGEK